jgi:tetratricopeptide (TPR) repeat protein
MIRALQPRETAASVAVAETSTPADKPPPPRDTSLVPQGDWSIDQFRRAYFFATFQDDQAAQEAVDSNYRLSLLAPTREDIGKWEAFQEFSKILGGKGGSLSKLRDLVTEFPQDSDIHSYLAHGLLQYKEFYEAARLYNGIAEKATTESEKLSYLGKACVALANANDLAGMSATVRLMRKVVEIDNSLELSFLSALSEAAEISKDEDFRVAVMERMVEIAPDDHETRFKLAYRHSQDDREDQALEHYLKVRQQERGESTWNNLGVAFDNLKMPGKAVSAYLEAKRLGETLAMSNLGNKLLVAGFLQAAQKECDEATRNLDYHKNVATLIARLKEIPDEEDKVELEVMQKVKPRSDFFRELGRSVARPDPAIFGDWQGPDCKLNVSMTGSVFKAEGEYERSTSNFLGMLSPSSKESKYRLTIKGSFSGHMLKGVISRERVGASADSAAILALALSEIKFLGVLSDDLTNIAVLENPTADNSKLYRLTRLHKPVSPVSLSN